MLVLLRGRGMVVEEVRSEPWLVLLVGVGVGVGVGLGRRGGRGSEWDLLLGLVCLALYDMLVYSGEMRIRGKDISFSPGLLE